MSAVRAMRAEAAWDGGTWAHGSGRARGHRHLRAVELPPAAVVHPEGADCRERDAAADSFFSRTWDPALVDSLRRLHDLAIDCARARELYALCASRRAIVQPRDPMDMKIEAVMRLYGAQLRAEVQLDARARQLRGAPGYPDAEAEVTRRACRLAHLAVYGCDGDPTRARRSAPPDVEPRQR
ncbi:hypothetical protein GCM10009808_25770 [Microbacterium sediminicola]|uniref:Uncharacterized protein n=1 Tax=Microbacterium sediminicola TaxID=415210 RepID=A0ABN2IK17_9MICO